MKAILKLVLKWKKGLITKDEFDNIVNKEILGKDDKSNAKTATSLLEFETILNKFNVGL